MGASLSSEGAGETFGIPASLGMDSGWSTWTEGGVGVPPPGELQLPEEDAPSANAPAAARPGIMSPGLRLALSMYSGSCLESAAATQASSAGNDQNMVSELTARLHRRPDAEALQFILNVAQLLGNSAPNGPLILPQLPMILHGMARHLESAGVQECGIGLFANLAASRGNRDALVSNGCLQHVLLALRQCALRWHKWPLPSACTHPGMCGAMSPRAKKASRCKVDAGCVRRHALARPRGGDRVCI